MTGNRVHSFTAGLIVAMKGPPVSPAPTRSSLERFFSGTRIAFTKRTIGPERNDMTTLEPKSGLRPIPTMHVPHAQNSPTAGLGLSTQAAQTDSHRIPFSSEKVRDLAVKMKSIPCVHHSPVHFLMVIRQITRARANRFAAGS